MYDRCMIDANNIELRIWPKVFGYEFWHFWIFLGYFSNSVFLKEHSSQVRVTVITFKDNLFSEVVIVWCG